MVEEKRGGVRARVSLGALAEVVDALRDYEEEVREAGCARDGISETTIKTYIRGPEKFIAWLKYDFAPGPPNAPTLRGTGIDVLKIERLPPKKSRISLLALAEADAAFDRFIREMLQAALGERATNQLGDHADYFMRWLRYDFAPGVRKGWGERRKKG